MNDQAAAAVTFNFVRSADYRVFHMNGVWGGLTPSLELSMAFFVERRAHPQSVTYAIEDGVLGQELARDEELPGVLERELQVEIRMNGEQARKVHEWLGRHLATLEERISHASANGPEQLS